MLDQLRGRLRVAADGLGRQVAGPQRPDPRAHQVVKIIVSDCRQRLDPAASIRGRSSGLRALCAEQIGSAVDKTRCWEDCCGRLDLNRRPAACKPASPQRNAHQRRRCSAASGTGKVIRTLGRGSTAGRPAPPERCQPDGGSPAASRSADPDSHAQEPRPDPARRDGQDSGDSPAHGSAGSQHAAAP